MLEIQMPSTDAFALRRSELNEFLFAAVGTEKNGMTLSVLSVFGRLGRDPWREAGRLASLPKLQATESLAGIITSMPTSTWPLPAATEIACRLVVLLPKQSGELGYGPPASAFGERAGRFFRIGVVLACIAFAAAYEAGVFTTMVAPRPHGNDVVSFPVSRPQP